MATKEDVLAALAAVKGPDGAPLTQTGKLSDLVVSGGKVFFSITVDAAVVQAWELASWLTRRLGWKVRAGRVEPGIEIEIRWTFDAPHGPVVVRIKRLSEGPSEVRQVRLQCRLDEQPAVLVFRPVDATRLEVTTEGVDAAPLTVTVQPQSLAELVGRQLSDRERDPVFTESIATAQVLAQSVTA